MYNHKCNERATEYDQWALFLRCLINCDKTATSISTRISLTTVCTGHACATAQYQWQLVSLDPNGNEVKATLTRDMTQTDLNLPGIIVKENNLSGGLIYRLKVTASPDNGPPGNAAYQFEMNVPPHSGQCTVTPGSGEALKTKFDFRCTGWRVITIIMNHLAGLIITVIHSYHALAGRYCNSYSAQAGR